MHPLESTRVVLVSIVVLLDNPVGCPLPVLDAPSAVSFVDTGPNSGWSREAS